jgi:hypothetical protein
MCGMDSAIQDVPSHRQPTGRPDGIVQPPRYRYRQPPTATGSGRQAGELSARARAGPRAIGGGKRRIEYTCACWWEQERERKESASRFDGCGAPRHGAHACCGGTHAAATTVFAFCGSYRRLVVQHRRQDGSVTFDTSAAAPNNSHEFSHLRPRLVLL